MSIFLMNLKRNLKGAFTTVKANFREYICFFLALILVQMLFCTTVITVNNGREVEKSVVAEQGYDYHCVFTGLYSADVNRLISIRDDYRFRNELYFSLEFSEGDSECRVTFDGHLSTNMALFESALEKMNESGPHASLSTTPLYDYESSAVGTYASLFPILLLLMGLSFLLLTALFRIRINHFKFTYSIYLAYGADYKKLLQSAFFEMLLIVLFSFAPAVVLSYMVAAFLYLPFGNPFGFYFSALPLTLICTFVCMVLALLLPIRILASTAPVKLMKAEDNSNLVSSPGKSLHFLSKKPAFLEYCSFWRFRKHTATLLLSTVSFAILFLLGCYIADAYSVRSEVVRPDLTVTFRSTEELGRFLGYFEEKSGEKGVNCALEKYAESFSEEEEGPVFPHLLLSSDRSIGAFYTAYSLNDGLRATESLDIRAFDEDALDCFSTVFGYTSEGHPERALTDPNAVIVSSSLSNGKANTLKPGDTIYVSTGALRLPDNSSLDDSLKDFAYRLEHTVYTYRAFTVAAVVTNYADYTNMLLYLPTCREEGADSGYEAVIGHEPAFLQVRLYPEEDSDRETARQIIKEYSDAYGGLTYREENGSLEESLRKSKNVHGILITLSAFLLLISPMAGIFSQVLFYEKRQLEFDVLRAVGAVKKDLKRLFLIDALLNSLLSGAVYTGVSFLAVRLLCKFLNSPYAFLFSDVSRASIFSPEMPLVPFFIGLVLTLLFAAFAVFLPAYLYFKKTSDHVAADFAQTDDL